MIISQTPLRISFAGGGTDLKVYYSKKPGMVISSAIDKYLFVIVNERFDRLIYVNYTKKEIVENVKDIKHDLVRESLQKAGIKNGIEITILADIPSAGSGLGSSSSLTVGLLNAFYNFKGTLVSADKLAREACEIEIDILKNPIGKQDQYIAAYGGIKKIIFYPNEKVKVNNINLTSEERIKIGSNLLLHYTRITRDSNTILTNQRKDTKNKLIYLNKILQLVPEFEKELNKRNWDAIGRILLDSWNLKKQLASGISIPYIETMVNLSLNNGALGVKVPGAGGGGFLLSYVPRNNQEQFLNSMKIYPDMPFMLDPFGSRIIFNTRRYNARTSY